MANDPGLNEGVLTDEGELLFAAGKAYLHDPETQEIVRAPYLDSVVAEAKDDQ